MSLWPRVDFKKMVEKVCKSRCDKSELTILGGQCTESNLLKFLTQWDLAGMPFRVWEYVSEIAFEKNTLPQNIALLERGRIFGDGGDLMLRRNITVFDWRFVGPAGIKLLPDEHVIRDYWQEHPDMMFHQYNETALLWGKRDENERDQKDWKEERVAAAKLSYPSMGRRIQLHYKVFSSAGRVKFIWYTGFSEWKEAHHHEGDY
ncbi:hypothetical protein [Carboxydocella sp. ULO1]|uniref:hypothetical protein n=1 Tax=Carboxydocella sp. ULO1 TaxID=1926599 RepID=UPI0009AF1D62|nr:hypothetical protein [Carboxydocella sp. ULO1]GAW27543.1 hypothetical protein ULO1_01130 [Carboxydocella sp. ULO1]